MPMPSITFACPYCCPAVTCCGPISGPDGTCCFSYDSLVSAPKPTIAWTAAATISCPNVAEDYNSLSTTSMPVTSCTASSVTWSSSVSSAGCTVTFSVTYSSGTGWYAEIDVSAVGVVADTEFAASESASSGGDGDCCRFTINGWGEDTAYISSISGGTGDVTVTGNLCCDDSGTCIEGTDHDCDGDCSSCTAVDPGDECTHCDVTPSQYQVTFSGVSLCTACYTTPGTTHAQVSYLNGFNLNGLFTLTQTGGSSCTWKYVTPLNSIRTSIFGVGDVACSNASLVDIDSTVTIELTRTATQWQIGVQSVGVNNLFCQTFSEDSTGVCGTISSEINNALAACGQTTDPLCPTTFIDFTGGSGATGGSATVVCL